MKGDLGKMTPLRLLCLRHRMTRQQVAECAGVSLRTMYNIEKGETVADETIVKIADVLGETPMFVAGVLSGKIELQFEVRAVAA